MNRWQKGLTTLALALVALFFLFPPYYGIDTASDGRLHAFAGYHPVWDPPSQEDLLAVFEQAGLVEEGRLLPASLEGGLNTVRLGFNILILGIATLIGLAILRTRRRGGGG